MIQYYINSRPVPRAIARHHLEQSGLPRNSAQNHLLWANPNNGDPDPQSVRLLADHGVLIAKV